MATNYKQEGDVLTLTAPYTVTPGQGALVGAFFGVALADVTSGSTGEFAMEGVWTLTCVSGDTLAVGAKVYWDNGERKCCSSSTGNEEIGAATAIKTGGATTCTVRLNGVAL